MKKTYFFRAVLGLVAAALAVGLSACGLFEGNSYRDDSGQVTASASINPSQLQTGDCIVDYNGLPNSITTLDVVPCTDPHEAEVFAVNSSATTDDDVNADFCKGAFQTYIGVSYDESELYASWIISTSNRSDTAVLSCIVYDKENSSVTTSFKGSQR